MRMRHLSAGLAFFFAFSCRTTTPQSHVQGEAETPGAVAEAAASQDPFSIVRNNLLNIDDVKGQTYLAFMQTRVKPALDKIATSGYPVGTAANMQSTYDNADQKVRRRIDSSPGGIEAVKSIATSLAGRTVTMANLPQAIRSVNSSVDQYDLSTFIGLASGGGVKIRYADGNYSYNIHYDTREKRSGRSFGVGPGRGANDASDKDYLDDLEEYVTGSRDNLPFFFRTMFQVLLNNDGSGYTTTNAIGQRLSDKGQALLSDFLAVYTAEQDRNLMDGEVSPYWDAALMEVTLLAAFHAGQSPIKLFYRNPGTGRTAFTSQTLKQTSCRAPSQQQQAHLRDYWQFSRNINDSENCRRSGINITKDEFRMLGKMVSKYIKTAEPALYGRVAASINASPTETNLFRALSYFLMNERAPASLDAAKAQEITDAWVSMLTIMANKASSITASIDQASVSGQTAVQPTPEMMTPL